MLSVLMIGISECDVGIKRSSLKGFIVSQYKRGPIDHVITPDGRIIFYAWYEVINRVEETVSD